MARVMMVGGGCRGRELAGPLLARGDAVRITTRTEAGRAAIEAVGAECWVGTPDRLATLRGALEGVTILCWLLGTASGPGKQLLELHDARLRFLLTQSIDTTVRGFVYEAAGTTTPGAALQQGETVVRELAARNAIPVAFLRADPAEVRAWGEEALAAIDGLLSRSI